MNKKKIQKIAFVIGLIITIISFGSFLKTHYWFYPGVIGIWLVFDYIASRKNKNTALQVLLKDKKKFFNLYLALFFLACTGEIIARFILKWWDYPYLSPGMYLFGLFLYPFNLFFYREMYVSIRNYINWKIALPLAMLVGIIVWELPNIFSGDWIYTIPFGFEIFNLNIIVIIGTIALIAFPVYIYREFFNLK